MSKPATIIIPSYCPTQEVWGYEQRCLYNLSQHTPRDQYDLIVVGGSGDWSFPQKINAAITGVRTEFVFVLSNDVFVPPGWMEAMLKCFEDAERIANCGILAPADDPQEKRMWWEEHWWALVLFRSSTFRGLGGFDEYLWKTYHDQDYSIRLKQAGYSVLRTNAVCVEHINMATRRHMPVDDSNEKAEMIRRYGVTEFRDYLEKMKCESLS